MGWLRITAGKMLLSGSMVLWCVFSGNAFVGRDSIMPTTGYELAEGSFIFLPTGVKVVRGVVLGSDITGDSGSANTIDHDLALLCHLWKFGCLIINKSGQNVQGLLSDAAKATGHKELANVPLVTSPGGRGVGGGWGGDAVTSSPSRCIAYYLWNYGVPDVGDKNLPRVFATYECRQEYRFTTMPTEMQGVRSQGLPVMYMPIWGYARGGYSVLNLTFTLFDWAIRTRMPSGTPPADGKVTLKGIPSEKEGWLGDPSTWFGDWPIIAPYNEYKGDKSLASWIPNKEMAYIWRAAVCRDSTRNQNTAGIWGVPLLGGHAGTNYTCSPQPQLGVMAPAKVYKKGEPSLVMSPRDTVIKVRALVSIENVKEIQLLENDRVFATPKINAYGVYVEPCTLKTPGIRALIVNAKLDDGRWVTSRPALIAVSEERASTAVRESESIFGTAGCFGPGDVSLSRSTGVARLTISASKPARMTVRLLDMKGATVLVLAHDRLITAGKNDFELKGKELRSNAYIAAISYGNQTAAIPIPFIDR